MTSRTRDQGTERRAETAVFGPLFFVANSSLSRFGEGVPHETEALGPYGRLSMGRLRGPLQGARGGDVRDPLSF